MEIEKNGYFLLEEVNHALYITMYQKGFSLLTFNELIAKHPRINLNRFKELRLAITSGYGEKVHIGDLKPEIECTVAEDKMSAFITLNCTEEAIRNERTYFTSEIINCLHNHSVKEGIMMDILSGQMAVNKEVLIARGIEPVDGLDAVITYFKRSVRKPTIREDGKADYYDMNFLDEVKTGDWLGEKIPATKGTPGKTITGEYVVQKNGKNKKLVFDQKTVEACEENGKIVLRALRDGVVETLGGKIQVGDHLIINGDVGVETGNIDFNGSITINGTVCENYSVKATKDLAIESEHGISHCDRIESVTGDIYIRGGIFGKGKSVVKAGKNIYVKHANECFLEALGTIHIGYYALGSHLKANHIIADEKNGKLIGGVIEARGKVKAAIVGNRLERKTIIQVAGFDRKKVEKDLKETLLEYKANILKMEQLKQKIELFDSIEGETNVHQKFQYEQLKKNYDQIMVTIFQHDEKRRYLMDMLEIKGDGEVTIGQMAFPDTYLEIKSLQRNIKESIKGTFFAENNNMHFE